MKTKNGLYILEWKIGKGPNALKKDDVEEFIQDNKVDMEIWYNTKIKVLDVSEDIERVQRISDNYIGYRGFYSKKQIGEWYPYGYGFQNSCAIVHDKRKRSNYLYKSGYLLLKYYVHKTYPIGDDLVIKYKYNEDDKIHTSYIQTLVDKFMSFGTKKKKYWS